MRSNLFYGVAAAALLMPFAAHAQETTSAIRGTVTQDGTAVAGAQVVITNVPSGTRSTTTTDANGVFNANGLRPGGPYSVEVTSPLGTTQVTDIYTVVAQPYDVPIDLPAQGAQDIVVTASTIAGAGTVSQGPRTVLTKADIAKVASVNRDVRDLERRDPFATLDLSNSRAVSFAGVNPRFNRFTINGVQVGDQFGLNPDASPTARGPVPFDAISQFSVSMAPYDIRQGNFVGGAIDTVLASGTNQFHGTGFYSQSTNGLQGSQIGSTRIVNPDYKSETYGVTLSGPIIKDKLFFMVSGERNTDPRPFSTSAISQIPGLTQGVVDQVSQIAQNKYGFNPGGFVSITNNKDEKIVGRIDWNITDGQKLSLSYINAYDSQDVQSNTSTSTSNPSLGLASNYYTATELLRAGIVQLNSDWTDSFSTEARFLYKSYERTRNPLAGDRGFAQFNVCTSPTSINSGADTLTSCGAGVPRVVLGTEQFSQSNALSTDTFGGSLLARLTMNNHDLKVLAEYNRNHTFNLFVPSTLGVYYFDSLADFAAGNASQLLLGGATDTANPNSAAADFSYGQFTFGIQDDWQITPTLGLTYGIRYDLFSMRDEVPVNANFVARTGFANTKTYKGLDNVQPRIGFDWKPNNRLSVRGGFGIFAGGSPDIYLSNSFSNTGTLTNSITVNRTATDMGLTTSCSGASGAACTGALNGVTGTSVPDAVSNLLNANPASLANAQTAALAPDFKLPSVYKANLSVDYRLFGVDVGADYLFTRTRQGVTFYDARVEQIGTLPDGRPRYAPVTNFGDSNYDIILDNTTRGRSHVWDVRAEKRFDFGLTVGGSYTWQDVKDVSPATSSQASSLYGQAAMVDPNMPAYGRSNDETKWAFKYSVGFDHAFFGDYRTIVQLFGETRAGRPYSYTMQSTGSRSAVFGTTNSNTNAQTRYLLYVPTSPTDALVSYDSAATRDSLNALIDSTELKNFRGKIAPKNISRNRAFTRIDLHLEQELPTFLGRSRVSVFGDIENLPNLLNSDWGGLRQLGFPYTSSVVQVTCLSATGGVVADTSTPCAQYRYSSYRAPNTAAVSTSNSLYLIRIGARFTF